MKLARICTQLQMYQRHWYILRTRQVSATCTALLPQTQSAWIWLRTSSFETITPTYMALGQFMRETDYKNPTDASRSPWHLAHNTVLAPFEWLKTHPIDYNYFVTYMTTHRDGLPIWLDAFPFEQELCQNITPEDALFIDIGGSTGQQCKTLRERYHGPGRLILQDQPEVIERAIPTEGVEKMVYNFWTPQPIKGKSRRLPIGQSNDLLQGVAHTICATFSTTGLTTSASRFSTTPGSR